MLSLNDELRQTASLLSRMDDIRVAARTLCRKWLARCARPPIIYYRAQQNYGRLVDANPIARPI